MNDRHPKPADSRLFYSIPLWQSLTRTAYNYRAFVVRGRYQIRYDPIRYDKIRSVRIRYDRGLVVDFKSSFSLEKERRKEGRCAKRSRSRRMKMKQRRSEETRRDEMA